MCLEGFDFHPKNRHCNTLQIKEHLGRQADLSLVLQPELEPGVAPVA